MSEPFSNTVVCCIGTVRGTLTSMSASPPVTMLAGLDKTRIAKSCVVSAAETGAPPSAQTQASAAQANLLITPLPSPVVAGRLWQVFDRLVNLTNASSGGDGLGGGDADRERCSLLVGCRSQRAERGGLHPRFRHRGVPRADRR